MRNDAQFEPGKLAAPIIRWAGSKRKILPEILKLIPDTYRRYYEPFVGSGCLFFALSPERATLGDINQELISAYRSLRRNPTKLQQILSTYPRTKKFYYQLRDHLTAETTIERTARFLYLNRFCFNGLYRTNKRGHFNVPKGTKTGDIPTATEFRLAAKQLRNAELVCGDFEDTIAGVKRGDLVYLDPPYASKTTRDRNEYGIGSFKPDDIPRLLGALHMIHNAGASFILSYSTAPDFIRQLPTKTLRKISVSRTIASNPVFRTSVPEVLLNNDNLF